MTVDSRFVVRVSGDHSILGEPANRPVRSGDLLSGRRDGSNAPVLLGSPAEVRTQGAGVPADLAEDRILLTSHERSSMGDAVPALGERVHELDRAR